MQIPPFLLDEWLNHYHFASTPPEFDLASSTGPSSSISEILALMTPDERERWIIDRDRARQQQYVDARGYFTISNSPLGEELALVALRHRDRILARTRRSVATNLRLLDQFFSEWEGELGWVRPRGGMICFPWLKRGGDAREFCRAVAERGTLLAPGDCFGMPEHFRLGFGVTEKGFGEGLQRIADHQASLAKKAVSKTTVGV